MEKISVVINTYNAEKHLTKVLNSVKLFDEILICDMESTDKTVSIANEYGCRIITFKKKQYNIVEPAREFAIHEAINPWVLVVDADEIVTKELRLYLYDLVNNPNAPDGVKIPRKNYFMGKFMHCYYPDKILRFFKKDITTWPPIIHAVPIVKGKVVEVPQKRKDLAFIHLANESVTEIINKSNIYSDNQLDIKKKHYSSFSLLYRPIFFFIKTYFLKGGIKDGKIGFIRSY